MSVIRSESTLMGRTTRLVGTGAADDRSLVFQRQTEAARGWGTVIDQLLLWWENPAWAGDDEGFVAPARSATELALQLAQTWRDQGVVAPLRVIPDGEGGIAFERREGPCFTSLRIALDGLVELLNFENSRLVSREQL